MSEDVHTLLRAADHVLIAFDGPLCPAFDLTWSRSAAQRLRIMLGDDLPRSLRHTDDPFAVLRFAASCGETTAHVFERQLYRLELEAAMVTEPTEGALDAMRSLFGSGHTVTVIGNQSTDAIRGFLGLRGVKAEVRRISARGTWRTALLADPFLLSEAVAALGTTSQRCVFIGRSVMDVRAGRAAGIPMIRYGRMLRGVAATIESMADLGVGDLLSWRG
ncbi:MAG TPA: HAD family hydrolase [Pseudonocardiaceae bacterium]|nr:HAD family hydrolase [Pseudonocardiaceae bacterium]